MKEETAIDWFFNKIKSNFEDDGDKYETFVMCYTIAKQKEKKQSKNIFKTEKAAIDFVFNNIPIAVVNKKNKIYCPYKSKQSHDIIVKHLGKALFKHAKK